MFEAKQTHMSFPLSENKALNCFDLIHCDIWGSYHVKAYCGAQYFLTFVDNASQRVWIFLMKEKGEASQLLKDFFSMAWNLKLRKLEVIMAWNSPLNL